MKIIAILYCFFKFLSFRRIVTDLIQHIIIKTLWGFCGDQHYIVMHYTTFLAGIGNYNVYKNQHVIFRMPGFEPRCRGFNPLRAHHLNFLKSMCYIIWGGFPGLSQLRGTPSSTYHSNADSSISTL